MRVVLINSHRTHVRTTAACFAVSTANYLLTVQSHNVYFDNQQEPSTSDWWFPAGGQDCWVSIIHPLLASRNTTSRWPCLPVTALYSPHRYRTQSTYLLTYLLIYKLSGRTCWASVSCELIQSTPLKSSTYLSSVYSKETTCTWKHTLLWKNYFIYLFSGPEVLFQDLRRDEIRGWWWWWWYNCTHGTNEYSYKECKTCL